MSWSCKTEIFELNHNNNTNNNHQQPLSFLLIRPDQIVGARFYHDKNIRTTTETVQKQVNEGVECIVGKKKVRNINKRGGDWPIKKDDATTRNNVLVASSSSNIQFGGLNDSNVLLGTRGGRNSKLWKKAKSGASGQKIEELRVCRVCGVKKGFCFTVS